MMMRFKIIFITFAILHINFSKNLAQDAPPLFDWQHSLGGTSYDAATKIIHSVDGGYILIGTTNSTNGDVTSNHGTSDVWVVKLDAIGNKQWQKTFGGSNVDVAVSGVQIASGKVFIAAYTGSTNGDVTFSHGLTDIWILALAPGGNLLWQKTFGGNASEVAHAIINTTDNNLLIAGNSQSNTGDVTGNQGGDDYWLLKTDTLGNILWQTSIGGSGTDICNAVTEMNDGGFIAAGSSNSMDGDVTGNHGGIDYWIAKVDNNGILQWQKSYGGSLNESALTVVKSTAGKIVIGGYSNSKDGDITDNHGSSDYWMVTLDSTGTLLTQNSYGGSNSDVSYSIVQAADGGYLLAGGTTSNDWNVSGNHGGEDFWVMKTDINGNVNWSKTFGGSQSDRAASVIPTSDGGFIMAGYSYSNDQQVSGNHGSADLWVAKTSCFNPSSAFTFNSDTVCINSVINLTNTSVNSAVYTWLADGITFSNNTDASFQFNSLKTYEIGLVSATCYDRDTASHLFTVMDYPIAQMTVNNFTLISGAANSYQWHTNGVPIAGATNQSYNVIQNGYYLVEVTNAGGCSSKSDSMLVDLSLTTNSMENNFENIIFPNPANDHFFISTNENLHLKSITLTDATGKVVLYNQLNPENKTERINISTTGFESGIYLLHLESKDQAIIKKLVISH